MGPEILLIDDEADLIESLGSLLTESGFPCLSASSGKDALKLISENDLSLVICDISMPGLSGIQLLEEFRKLGAAPACVMLTAHTERERIKTALQLGAFDYVNKPFNIPNFISRIPLWLEAGRKSKRARASSKEAASANAD